MKKEASRQITVDTVVIGGGVAALWTANALIRSGRSVIVLTNAPLGGTQTLASQGVIHGGLKYAVGGKLNDSSEALAAMPKRWAEAMRGNGEVDLRKVEILSDHQILWSLPGILSKVVSFFGSKSLRGRAEAIPRESFPEVFDTPKYKGQLFRIGESVIDPVSLVKELALPLEKCSYLVDWKKNAKIVKPEQEISHIKIQENRGEMISLSAKDYIFAAGKGNADLLSWMGVKQPEMQVRPLHQLVIRKPGLPDFFSVCIGNSPKPPLVSTTHRDAKGRTLWYVGGDLAEADGVARSEAGQIEAGKKLFKEVMPWIDLSDADWFTVRVDRAEPSTATGARPPGAFCEKSGNVMVTWPTKLALAPDLADKVLANISEPCSLNEAKLDLPHPGLGKAPWDLD